MAILETGDKKYSTLLDEIEKGEIKIPQFQRQFVWDIQNSAKLIDSILKGYPIGTFIYWRTSERLRSIRNIGNIVLPEPRGGEFINYVLDGQQRITSLFAALKGEVVERDNGKKDDFSKIYIDFEAQDDDPIVFVDLGKRPSKTYVKLTDLMNQGRRFFNDFPPEYDSKIDKFKEIIQSYQFRGVNLKDAPIDVATEVFTRLNVGGKDLSLFEIMVAKTYQVKEIENQNGEKQEEVFDLYEKFEDLKEELEPIKYDTISSATILQLVSILIKKECTRKVILNIEKEDFINKWDEAVSSLKSAIDFLRGYGIPVSRLLPYNALLVPFAYFFHHHKSNPTGEMKSRLEDFFWRVSLGFRYSSGVENKISKDVDKIDEILSGKLPKYEWQVDTSTDSIKALGWFSAGRSFIKAILCLYSMQNPKSFDNNLEVNIRNDWLKKANSKNYHHFFPKAYMRKEQPEWDDSQVNHIINITIVDDYLNKNRIRAKAPSDYLSTFISENDDIHNCMRSHLVELEGDGVLSDNYERFYNLRAQRISEILSNKLILQSQENEDLEIYEEFGEEEDNAD